MSDLAILLPLVPLVGIVAIGILYTWSLVVDAKAAASWSVCPRCGADLEEVDP